MNEPNTTGASAVPPSALESLTRQFLNATPLGLSPQTQALLLRFTVALAEKLGRAEKKYGYTDGWRESDWVENGECAEELLRHVAKGDPLDVAAYCAFLWHHNAPTADTRNAELTHLRERVKELEADGRRLDELMWRNDIMVKVFRGGIVVVLKPYGTPSFPLRAAIDAALKGDAK